MSQFEVVLEAADSGPGCGIRLPFDPRVEFGKARAPVRVTVDDFEPFRTTVAVYGGVGWVGLRKDQQAAMAVGPGDRVTVQVERDDEPRTVEVPQELAAALSTAPEAKSVFDGLSYTHRREYCQWVGEAKREDTRARRAAKAVDMLAEGTRHP